MFVKEDKKGQHYYSLIFYISQSEYRKRIEAGCNVNVWEEPGDILISKLSEHLSLSSVSALSNWTSREVADCSNKVFSWCLSSRVVLCTELRKERAKERGGCICRMEEQMDEIPTQFPAPQQGFCFGTVVSSLLWAQPWMRNKQPFPRRVDGKC